MPRASTPKKGWPVLVTSGIVLAVVGIYLYFSWLPDWSRQKLEKTLRARGFEAEIDKVTPGFFSLQFDGVRLDRVDPGKSVSLDFRKVRVGIRLAALWGDHFPISSIESTSGRVAVFFRPSEHDAETTDDGSDKNTSVSILNQLSDVRFDLSGLQVGVEDHHGKLLSSKLSIYNSLESAMHVELTQVQVGAPEADSFFSERMSLTLAHSATGIQLQRVVVSGGEVLYDPEPKEEPLLARLRKVRRKASGGREGKRKSASSSGMFSDLEVFFQIERVATTERLLLENLKGKIVNEDRAVSAEFRGDTDLGGELVVDMQVWPRDVRAEGDIQIASISLGTIAPFLSDLPLYESVNTRLSGNFSIKSKGSSLKWVGGGEVQRLQLKHPKLAGEEVVRFDPINFQGSGEAFPAQKRLRVDSGSFSIASLRAEFSGQIKLGNPRQIALSVQVPPTACNDVFHAIPSTIAGPVTGFGWSGSFGLRGTLNINEKDFDATKLEYQLANKCKFQTIPGFADLRKIDGTFVHRVVIDDEEMFKMVSGRGSENWTRFADINNSLIRMVLAHEDGAFFKHRGFSKSSIRRALVRNLKAGRYVRGASTITMQLAKNLFLSREKTVARKARELILTWWLETALSKEVILEIYLNIIEYGPTTYGITQAAQEFFNKTPRELSLGESAYLATTLPSPSAAYQNIEQGSLSDGTVRRVTRFLDTLLKKGKITPLERETAVGQLPAIRLGEASHNKAKDRGPKVNSPPPG